MAAATIAVLFTAPARADEPVGLRYDPASWVSLELQAVTWHPRFAPGDLEYVPGAVERSGSAGATVRYSSGWSASLFVSYFGRRQSLAENAVSLKPSSFVNARLSRNLSKNTRVTFDVFNVFDQRIGSVDYFSASHARSPAGAGESFLFNPDEPRGFRVRLRTTF